MHVYFATNRNVRRESATSATFGDRFNPDGPQFFRVGRCTAGLKVGSAATDDDGFGITEINLYAEKKTARSQPQPQSARLFDELRQRLRDEAQDVLVFLHGFANDFESSIQRAAALQHLYSHGEPDRHDPIVFAFAWPSNGRTFPRTQYFSDRDDARMSGLAMARALLALLRFMQSVFEEDERTIMAARSQGEVPNEAALKRCSARLHLLAHSMGNWALRHAVLKIREELGVRPLPRLFKHALLVAADEDADALTDDDKLGLLFELAQNVHVYHSSDDKALQISTSTKNNPERLGSDGPSSLTTLPARAYVIDCSAVDRSIPEHGSHQYYRIRQEVIDDIKAVLEGQAPDHIVGREVLTPGRAWRIKARR